MARLSGVAALGVACSLLGAACAEGGSRAPTTPEVDRTEPALGATGVSVVPRIQVVWTTPMDITQGTLQIDPGSESIDPAGDAWSAGNTTLTVQARQTLPPRTRVTVELAGFVSEDGVPIEASHRFSFTTGDDLDPPGLATSSPREGQVDIDPDALDVISITFDEAMDTLATNPLAVIDDGPERPLAGRWREDGRTFEIEAAVARLPFNAAASIDLTGFSDAAGNAFPSDGAGNGRLDFETGPNRRLPTVQSAIPLEGAEGVADDLEAIEVIFSEAMDETVVVFDLEQVDGGTISLSGSYEEDGLVLILPLPEPLEPGARYRLDLRGARDVLGMIVPDDDPFTGDGVLDFRVRTPSGEDCDTALRMSDGVTEDGRTTFILPPSTDPGSRIAEADGGVASCSPLGPSVDAVFVYEKATPSLSEGGAVLHVSALTEGAELGLEIVEGACAPASTRGAEEQLACTTGRRRWDRFLDVGEGTYFVFVTGAENSDAFPGATVSFRELTDPAELEGESCAAPFTVESDNYTRLPSGAHRWEIDGSSIHGLDMSRTWGIDEAMSCINDFRYGDRSGVDAVIEVDKKSEDTLLAVTGNAVGFGVAFEVFQSACGPPADRGASAACRYTRFNGSTSYVGYGYRGPVHIWVSQSDRAVDLHDVTLDVEELSIGDGQACARALPLEAGSNPIATRAVDDIDRPGCFSPVSRVVWYRYRPTHNVVLVDTDNGESAEAFAVRPTGDRDPAFCGTSPRHPIGVIVDPGEDVCVGIEEGAGTTAIEIADVEYTGAGTGSTTRVRVTPPPSETPGFPPGIAELWLAVDGDRAYVSEFTEVIEVDLTTGGTVVHDDTEGLGSFFGAGGAVAEGALFAADRTFLPDTPRVYRLWDGMTATWSPAAWEDGAAYESGSTRGFVYDGDRFWIGQALTDALYNIPREGGALTVATSGTGEGLPRFDGFDVDDVFVYGASRSDRSIWRAPIDRLGDDDVPTETVAALDPYWIFALDGAVVVDGDATSPSSYLYARASIPGGVLVIEDPAGPSPRVLGMLVSIGANDDGLYYDHARGRLAVYSTENFGTFAPEILLLD